MLISTRSERGNSTPLMCIALLVTIWIGDQEKICPQKESHKKKFCAIRGLKNRFMNGRKKELLHAEKRMLRFIVNDV